ncbi:MAG: RNA methyltransferase [Proteobacteria bacterium]|nr:RNA methyltransferase [Pseudomonadota bacterium]
MNESGSAQLYIALIHHPVLNKKGDVICSAITNLDLHDIARAAQTFGVKRYYVVNPLTDQVVLADKIVHHWTEGKGGQVNPARRKALSLIRITSSLDDVIEDIVLESGQPVKVIATSARQESSTICFSDLKKDLACGDSVLLLFGTAWGLAEEIMDKAHGVLEPVMGNGEYNHLSVRSAVSIILDRVMSSRGRL